MADATPNPAPKDYLELDDPPLPMTPLDTARVGELTKLARDSFPDLSDAEAEVVRISAMFVDPEKPDGKLPRIRAEFLRWLVTDAKAAPHISSKGLRVFGVTIPGDLDLWGCRITVPMTFWRCTFEQSINLQSAETRDLFLLNCTVGRGLIADRILVNGPLYLRGSSFSRAVGLLGAKIKGDLDCQAAQLRVAQGIALNADRLEVEGNVFLIGGFEASGEIRLLGAQIKGDLDCSGAKLLVKTGNSLSADSARVDGNVILARGFKSTGAVCLPSARIGRDLSFIGAEVGTVFCSNLQLSGDLQWVSVVKSQDSYFDFSGATVKNFHDDKDSWPNENGFVLNGLTYTELTLHEPPKPEDKGKFELTDVIPPNASDRIAWLMLQERRRRDEPQPWMQLSALLAAKGNRKGAKHVLFELDSLQAHKLKWHPAEEIRKTIRRLGSLTALVFHPWDAHHPARPYIRNPNRSWALAFAWLQEAPQRILYSIAVTLILGTLVFAGAGRSGAMIPTDAKAEPDHYPPFQPFVYTFDNAVPLVKLGMDEKWRPDPHPTLNPWFPGHHWLDWLTFFNSYWFLTISRWLLMLSGWLQAAVLAAALSGMFKQ